MKTLTAAEKQKAIDKFSDYLSGLFENSKYMQREIADMLSSPDKKYTPTFINLVKKGKSKVPIYLIPKMARILGTNPKQLLMDALEAYQPEVSDVIKEEALMDTTDTEAEILNIFRTEIKNSNFELSNPDKKAIAETFRKMTVGR